MHRRTFIGGIATFAITACARSTERMLPPPADGGLLVADAAAPLDAGVAALFVIREAFDVLLNDSSCSHHSHGVRVAPGEYAEDVPVTYLGGSHELVFLASELVRLERGERVPFATTGDGPGHGHCGTAWRSAVGPEEPDCPDACTTRGTAMCGV